jgi:hypothetical protein
LLGEVPDTSIRLYSAQNHSAGTYTRNTSAWPADCVQALTALSPWNSESMFQKAGILVSPRHVLFATHYTPANSSTIRFVAADNTVITRTITSTLALTTLSSMYPDITVAVLDSDVPGTISFAKVLPASAAAKLPESWTSNPLPAVVVDQEEKATVRDWLSYAFTKGATSSPCQFYPPGGIVSANQEIRLPFYEQLVGGDSGSPAFVFIGSELVVLCVMTTGGPGAGTSITAFIPEINAAMTTLGGGYQLTPVDLSTYPDL